MVVQTVTLEILEATLVAVAAEVQETTVLVRMEHQAG